MKPPLLYFSAALGWDTHIFFTFYGLLLKKEIPSEVSALGNPAMPMKMPFGPKWFQNIAWPMPNLIMAGIPGFEKVATSMMKKTFKNKGVATVEELRELCIEADVKMYACQMTVDVFGFDHSEFIGHRMSDMIERFAPDADAGARLEQAGYDEAFVDRVKQAVGKKALKRNPDTQMVEDIAALVFIEHYMEDFAAKHPEYDEEKWITIVQRTWRKMSPGAHEFALSGGIRLPQALVPLIQKAVAA
ncbi:MAG: DUF4202 family protein [Chromatocurvus sp.]